MPEVDTPVGTPAPGVTLSRPALAMRVLAVSILVFIGSESLLAPAENIEQFGSAIVYVVGFHLGAAILFARWGWGDMDKSKLNWARVAAMMYGGLAAFGPAIGLAIGISKGAESAFAIAALHGVISLVAGLTVALGDLPGIPDKES